MLELVYLKDGTPEGQIESRAKALLKREGLFVESGQKGEQVLKYCGFVVSEDFIVISLPKTLSIPENGDLHICKLLHRTLLRYFREALSPTNAASIMSAKLQGDLEALGVFNVYDELLDDWSRFGVYRNRIKNERVGLSGKVNWKKTIKKLTPFHDKKDVPIYPLFCVDQSDLRLEGVVSDIHRWCVAIADHSIGWLKVTGSGVLLFPDIAHWRTSAPCKNIEAVSLLKKEMRKQYDQRKIRLLQLMVRLLEQVETASNPERKSFGVSHFWAVWESMCRALLNDESSHHIASLPQPKYLREDGTPSGYPAGIGQRPDIVFNSPNKCLTVVDAKYYDVLRNIPGWRDIVKQFFYAASYNTIGYAPKIRNAFLFPLPHEMQNPPVKVEMSVSEEILESDFDSSFFERVFSPIECKYLDMHSAMQHYVTRCSNDELRALIMT